MIACSCESGGATAETVEIVFPDIDAVELNVVFDVRSNGMHVQTAEVLTKLFLLLRPNVFEVLIAKNDDTALRDQKRKFVLLRVCQLRQLEACDLGANTRCELRDF